MDALTRLPSDFNARFKDFQAHECELKIMANPFEADVENSPLQMELTDLQSSEDYQSLYIKSESMFDFYKKLSADLFPEVQKHASGFEFVWLKLYL